MRIVKRKEFLAMPEGTLYQEYRPCVFGDLQIKYEMCGENDFFCQGLTGGEFSCEVWSDIGKSLEDAEHDGKSVPLDFEGKGREGLFSDDDELYAVWEKADIQKLIQKLTECIS